jgi:hypothetical protein
MFVSRWIEARNEQQEQSNQSFKSIIAGSANNCWMGERAWQPEQAAAAGKNGFLSQRIIVVGFGLGFDSGEL